MLSNLNGIKNGIGPNPVLTISEATGVNGCRNVGGGGGGGSAKSFSPRIIL